MAVDQAKTCGFAVFVDGVLLDYGVVELGRKKDRYEDILIHARNKISNLIGKYDADFIVLEDIQQQNGHVSTYKKLAMLMGVLVCLIQEMNLTYAVVPPTRWKSFCGIKGQKREEQKTNTILFAKERFGINDVTEDMADAVSLGWFAVNSFGTRGI